MPESLTELGKEQVEFSPTTTGNLKKIHYTSGDTYKGSLRVFPW